MSAASAPGEVPSLSAFAVFKIWAPHLAALLLPLLALALLLSAPHPWYVALAFIALPGVAIQLLDRRSGAQRRQPHPALPDWPFDALLFALVAIQLLNV